MTLGLKFLYGKIEMFNFKKTPFRYVFSIVIMYSCETVWLKVLLSKECLQWEIAVQTLYWKKKQREGKGGRLKDNEFSGVK